jgi:hypothetical protein
MKKIIKLFFTVCCSLVFASAEEEIKFVVFNDPTVVKDKNGKEATETNFTIMFSKKFLMEALDANFGRRPLLNVRITDKNTGESYFKFLHLKRNFLKEAKLGDEDICIFTAKGLGVLPKDCFVSWRTIVFEAYTPKDFTGGPLGPPFLLLKTLMI